MSPKPLAAAAILALATFIHVAGDTETPLTRSCYDAAIHRAERPSCVTSSSTNRKTLRRPSIKRPQTDR